MYECVSMRVRMNGKLGEEFMSNIGVKQGDPLSPLLFGLFIDRIDSFLQQKCPFIGARLREQIIRLILYADDLTLIAEVHEELQQLLDALLEFSQGVGLTVSVKKSEVLVFNKQKNTGMFKFKYNGDDLKITESFIYLGSFLCDDTVDKRAQCAFEYRFTKARRAWHLVQGRCHALGIHNVEIRLHLIDALVISSLNSGCEIWGPVLLNNPQILDKHDCELWHRAILKQLVGVCKSTTTFTLMEELNRTPIAVSWLKLVLGFWNRTIRKNDEDFVYIALKTAFENNLGWVRALKSALTRWGIHVLDNFEEIDVDQVVEKVIDRWRRGSYVLNTDIQLRNIPDNLREGFKTLKYKRWFYADPCMVKQPKYISVLHKFEQINTIAKFRMGCHWLNCETTRKVDGICLPRSKRVCTLCDFNRCEDEMHLFECPFYTDLRLKYQSLFRHVCCDDFQDSDMVVWSMEFTDDKFRKFMNGHNDPAFWHDLANYLIACRKKRQEGLSALADHNYLP